MMAETQLDEVGVTCKTKSHTVILEGTHWPWQVTQESLDALKNYEIRDDDVWVVTYPKAGSHWVHEIVQLLRNDGKLGSIDREQAPTPIEFVPYQPKDRPEAARGVNEKFKEPTYKRTMSWKSPRTIVTHLLEKTLPKQIYEGKGKVIYVTRNPKDTAVSFWHFLCPIGKNKPYSEEYTEWDNFYRLYCDGQVSYGSWFAHNQNFWKKHRHDKNFLFLKYEDMQKDLRGAVVQIADFIGHRPSDDIVDLVVQQSSHNHMKQRFHTGGPKIQSNHAGQKIGAPYMMRKGIVGDWKTLFTVAQNEAFDQLYRKQMDGSTLQVEFEI